jgi:hypothetical protein
MQGWGVLHALRPILERERSPAQAFSRHAVPFNCNLWTVPLVLGAMARLEAEERGDAAALLRDRVTPPLSAAGDAYVWRAARPAALTFAVLGILFGQPYFGLGIALGVHAAAVLRSWSRGFRLGASEGEGLTGAFARVQPDARRARVLQRALACVAGGLGAWGIATAAPLSPSTAFLMSAAVLVGYHAAQRKTPGGIAFVGWVLLASLLARFSNPLGPP